MPSSALIRNPARMIFLDSIAGTKAINACSQNLSFRFSPPGRIIL
jgi:hypothetical protein